MIQTTITTSSEEELMNNKVKVCDALCGFGKTSACIKMMNEAKDKKFIFVTQFLSEVERIKTGCAERHFVSPESNIAKRQTKLSDIHRLLEAGRNIATTHSLFVSYTEETKQLIEEKGYTLVLDESVDVLCPMDLIQEDVDILVRSNTIRETENGGIDLIFDDYCKGEHGRFYDELSKARSKNLLKFHDEFFCWTLPPELFTCFNEVYVLTYMFRAQPLCSFFEVHGILYDVIGVKNTELGYVFCPAEEMDRSLDLRDKIHILEGTKVNSIGDHRAALSVSWYNKARYDDDAPMLERLRKNISNVFKNIYKASSDDVLWTTFKENVHYLRGKGYTNGFLPYNIRASNEYADRRYLAYCVNNFPRPLEKRYYDENGGNWDADAYALSTMVQWVFRSAIRKGEEIWIYVPSRRMRTLFATWVEKLAEGKDLEPIKYQTSGKRSRKTKKNNQNNEENEG